MAPLRVIKSWQKAAAGRRGAGAWHTRIIRLGWGLVVGTGKAVGSEEQGFATDARQKELTARTHWTAGRIVDVEPGTTCLRHITARIEMI